MRSQVETIVRQKLAVHKPLIQQKPSSQVKRNADNKAIMDALLPIVGQDLQLAKKLSEDRPYDYQGFQKMVVDTIYQKLKKQDCTRLRQTFERLGMGTNTKSCSQMSKIACKTTNKTETCDPDLAVFQQIVRSKKEKRKQRHDDNVPRQQHMIPFLFQQNVQKRFKGVNLFYYDETWRTPQQKTKQKSSFFQQYFPELKQITKESASPTIVYRGMYKGRSIYVKSFRCGVDEKQFESLPNSYQRLSYEKEVYRYIRSVAEKDDEIRKHFINMLLCARDDTIGWAYIFSQDSGGKTLNDYMKEDPSCSFMKNIFTQYLYVLHLMHNKLHIVHNDLHFGNMLVVRDNQPSKSYTFGGKTFHLENHPYHLMVYDFDNASIYEPPSYRNPFLNEFCKYLGRCNDYPQTDLYIFTMALVQFFVPSHLNDYEDDKMKIQFIISYIVNWVLMPPGMYSHFSNTKYRKVSCIPNADANSECKHPTFDISIPILATFWWDALRTDINTLLPYFQDDILYFIWESCKEWIGKSLFLIKMDEETYHLTYQPSSSDIKRLIEMNNIIDDENAGTLIIPSYQSVAGVLSTIFKKQYKLTHPYDQIRMFQKYLR